ncbi:MAG: RcnB family protein [Candidatus Sphingomonas colombiensis]|nr:RcnB family protein [Sphingomonas sp.]WEK44865.1 MAG: RcnB family protein [Sphingomonas sp.]
MRTLILSAAALALLGAAGAVDAQRVAVPGPGGAAGDWQDVPATTITHPPRENRWGRRVDGRWWGGAEAPGGWAAYRQPKRGRALPSYWRAPDWYVADWRGYGLPQPPYGYNWSRYYDDAVLIDTRGRVYDSIAGVSWDRFDDPGADAGYYGAGALPPPRVVHAPDGTTVVTTSTAGTVPGYYADGYYYPAPTITTVTIRKARIGAAIASDSVTYTPKPAHRRTHKRKPRRR